MEETYRVQVLRLIVSFISITRIVVLLVLGIRTLVTLTRVLIWLFYKRKYEQRIQMR
jgi:hypothetical protein